LPYKNIVEVIEALKKKILKKDFSAISIYNNKGNVMVYVDGSLVYSEAEEEKGKEEKKTGVKA